MAVDRDLRRGRDRPWICRLIEWMSAIAAKSRYLRQMKGASSVRNAAPGGDVAGARTRLDHRGALPVLAEALVVVERRRQSTSRPASSRDRDAGAGRRGRRSRRTVRSCRSFTSWRVRRTNSTAGSMPCTQRRRIGIEEDDEVDVARIVELARADLAHGEDDVTGATFGAGGIGRREMAGPSRHRRGGDARQRRRRCRRAR